MTVDPVAARYAVTASGVSANGTVVATSSSRSREPPCACVPAFTSTQPRRWSVVRAAEATRSTSGSSPLHPGSGTASRGGWGGLASGGIPVMSRLVRTASRSRRSSTSRAMRPIVSREGAIRRTPSCG